MRVKISTKDCVVHKLSKDDRFPICVFSGTKSFLDNLLSQVQDMSPYHWTPWSKDGEYSKYIGRYVVVKRSDVEPRTNELGEVAP